VIGPAGSVAESIAVLLTQRGSSPVCIFDIPPVSPVLSALAKDQQLQVYTLDSQNDVLTQLAPSNSQSTNSLATLIEKKSIIACADDGDSTLRGPIDSTLLIKSLSKSIANVNSLSIKSVICASSLGQGSDSRGDPSFFGLLKGVAGGEAPIESIRKICIEKDLPFSHFKFGKLVGGIPGAEPLPFVGLPLQEPVLHPSYLLQSVVLAIAVDNKYAASETCTRSSLAEAAVRLFKRYQGTGTSIECKFSVKF